MPRSYLSLMITLFACTSPDATLEAGLPVDQAAPPAVNATALVRGERSFVTVTGLTPNQSNVTLLASGTAAGAAWCPPQIGGACTGLFGRGVVLGSARADASGVATFPITPGLNFPLDLIFVEAAVRSGGGFTFTGATGIQVLDPQGDADADGLINKSEARLRSNPLDVDSDDDTLEDGDEVAEGTSPTDDDSDDDGLDDGTEVEDGTDPSDDDSDDDGLDDGEEAAEGTDPNDDDSDDDGLLDGPEVEHGLDPNDDDCDDDGVDDGTELEDGSDPLDDDSDDDGVGDLEDTDDDNGVDPADTDEDTGADDTGVDDDTP
jgi:hypothetical protein